MKTKKTMAFAAICLGSALLLNGCSFSETLDQILGHTEKVAEHTQDLSDKKTVDVVDPDLQKPTFTVNLEGSVKYAAGMEAEALKAEATVDDGGAVTYQWYANNINANGGGELLEGKTESTCIPDTTSEGTRYYYVVATNRKGNSVAKSTSSTVEVNILPEGNWVEKNGKKLFQLYDGSYVKNAWKDIDDQRYAFDADGYMRSGWFKDTDNEWYYLNPDGTMAKDTQIDEYKIGADGKSADKKAAEEKKQ